MPSRGANITLTRWVMDAPAAASRIANHANCTIALPPYLSALWQFNHRFESLRDRHDLEPVRYLQSGGLWQVTDANALRIVGLQLEAEV